jgi:carotene epsilon-monooxygenase
LDAPIDTGKLIDAEGAGASFTSPGWLTQLGRLWGGKSVGRGLFHFGACLDEY